MTSEYKADVVIAVIMLNNPPVKGQELATRTACFNGFGWVLADDAVKESSSPEQARPFPAAPISANLVRPRR